MAANATVPLDTVSRLLDLSPRRVNQLVNEGVIPRREKGRYELVPVVRAYIHFLREKAVKGDVIDLSDVRQRKLTAEARTAELDLAQREGSMIPIEDVASIVAAEYTNVRSRLMAVPGTMATELEHLTPSEIQDKLAIAIEDVLGELSADEKYSTKTERKRKPARKTRLNSGSKS